MGMFDSVSFSAPPAGMPANGWQTKDLDCTMTEYDLAADGVMTSKHGRYEPPCSFVLCHIVDGQFTELQADVSNGRVTKISGMVYHVAAPPCR